MSAQIEAMIIPFQRDVAVVLPRSLVEYVLPYAIPLPSSYSHQALVGSILYQNEKVPILDVSRLLEGGKSNKSADSGHRRLVVVSCISEHLEFSSYAIIADDAPRLFKVRESALVEVSKELQSPFHSCVKLDKLPQYELLLIDLEVLELQVF